MPEISFILFCLVWLYLVLFCKAKFEFSLICLNCNFFYFNIHTTYKSEVHLISTVLESAYQDFSNDTHKPCQLWLLYFYPRIGLINLKKISYHLWPWEILNHLGPYLVFLLLFLEENRPTLFFNFRGGLFSFFFSDSPFSHKWHPNF